MVLCVYCSVALHFASGNLGRSTHETKPMNQILPQQRRKPCLHFEVGLDCQDHLNETPHTRRPARGLLTEVHPLPVVVDEDWRGTIPVLNRHINVAGRGGGGGV